MNEGKRAVRKAENPVSRNKNTWLISPNGELRTGWLLAASLFCYTLGAFVFRRALSAFFSALFDAWGVNAGNIDRAPGWAQAVYSWHGSLITVIVAAALLLLAALLRRPWHIKAGKPGAMGKTFAIASLAGLGAAMAIAVLCLAPDSSRLEWPLNAPRLSWRLPALCAISLLAAIAEEAFSKRVLFDGLFERWGILWAAVITCAVFSLSNGGYAGSVVSAINVWILGLLCCAIYVRRGLWAAIGFRWGWSVATTFLMGFGGGNAAVYRLYGLSEAALTGGDAGPIYGLWATLALAGMLLWLERGKMKTLFERIMGRRVVK